MNARSLEALSTLIESIYDCAFDAARWNEILPQVAAFTGSDAVALDFMDLARDEPVGAFSCGFDPQYRALLIQKYARIWMVQSSFHQWPVGKPMYLPDILPLEEFFAGAFYCEWCKPQANIDYIGMIAFRDSTRFVKLTSARLERTGPYEAGDRQAVELLAPHISKSVSISDAFRLERVRAGMFETMLENLTSGVLLVSSSGGIEYMNSAAREQIAQNRMIRIDGQRLRLSDRKAQARLKAALQAAQQLLDRDTTEAEFLSIPDGGSAGLTATILPLSRAPERQLLGAGHGSIAVFLRDPVKRPPFLAEVFSELFGLTPGETKVAAVLGQGETSPASVRSWASPCLRPRRISSGYSRKPAHRGRPTWWL